MYHFLAFLINFCPLKNVHVARFARNVEWDFFCDFQTPCFSKIRKSRKSFKKNRDSEPLKLMMMIEAAEIGPKQFLELLQSWVASRQTCRTTPQPWTTIPCVLMPSSHFLSTVSTAEAKQQPLNGMMQNSTWSTKLFYFFSDSTKGLVSSTIFDVNG